MPTLGLITASARPNRVGERVARWVGEQLPGTWDVDAIDLAENPLPFFDGASSPKQGLPRTEQHAIDWAARVDALDALVITTPEYNGSYPAILKNAIDYLSAELTDLPVVLVGYGWAAGAGSLEATERLLVRLGARIVGSVGLGFGTDLETDGTLHVTEPVTEALGTALTELATAVQETPAA